MKIFQIRLKLQRGKHSQLKTSSIKISICRFYFLVSITPIWTLVQNITHKCFTPMHHNWLDYGSLHNTHLLVTILLTLFIYLTTCSIRLPLLQRIHHFQLSLSPIFKFLHSIKYIALLVDFFVLSLCLLGFFVLSLCLLAFFLLSICLLGFFYFRSVSSDFFTFTLSPRIFFAFTSGLASVASSVIPRLGTNNLYFFLCLILKSTAKMCAHN